MSKQIEILNITQYPSYTEMRYLMRFTLPTVLGTSSAPVQGINAIISSQLNDGFSLETVKVTGNPDAYNLIYTQVIPDVSQFTVAQIKNQLVAKYGTLRTKLDNLTFKPFETLAMLSWDGTSWS